MSALEELEMRIMELEERLRPIAKRPVDVTRPGWFEQLQAGKPPLDEAGAREEMEQLLEDLIAAYAQGNEETQSAIRGFFTEYPSVEWAAAFPEPRTNTAGFRRHLILFSMKDQGRDSRDALLTLQEICREAAAAGVATEPVLREVAAMSSRLNKYGMGSTFDMLLRQCPGR